ncbi:MAG: xylulokinase [Planctomycetes bacterium]|nr:xylulokinase [Planctomycetota bacterium]
MGYLLGIDVGTSGARALVCDEDGRVLATATSEYPCYSPRPLWSEQDPADWWDGACKAIRAALAEAAVPGEEVRGIGLTGQMHGLVMLDGDNEVIRPAILWNDQRTAAECRQMTEAIGRDRMFEILCNPALTGFTAPKILWVRNHEPENYERCRHILLPKDYVRLRLSGTFATEVSDASGMLLLDIEKRVWSEEALEKLQIDRDLLAECYESPEVSAEVSAEAAAEIGIPAGTPIVGGGSDQAAGAVGNGIVRAGAIGATIGTSGVVFAFSDEVATDPQGRLHTFCHAVPGKWHVMGVVLSAGGSLQWFRDNLAQVEREQAARRGVDPYELLTEQAARAVAGAEGLMFLPYLTGERTPHADPNARGALVGLTPRHGKAEVIRSIMEGITYAMKDSLEIIHELEVPVSEIRLSGGGARSEFWRQMQADVYAHSVCTINASEGPAYGAALLAGVGAGVWRSVQSACEGSIRVESEYAVNEEQSRIYSEFYPLWRRLYRSLAPDFEAITQKVEQLYG